MPVRVIRVLEYEYPDYETAERDMRGWVVPANGVWGPSSRRGSGPTIRSATTFPAMTTEALSQEILKSPQVVLDVLQAVFAPEHDELAKVKLTQREMAIINNWINLATGQGSILDFT